MTARGGLREDGAVRGLRFLVLGLGAALFVLFAWVVVARFRYPVDSEWMTGAVRDTVARVRRGEAIYTAPSASFAPFLYPPLYFWASAALAHVVSVFVACKMVSTFATFATAASLFGITRALGASPFHRVVAVLLYIGTYSIGLFFFDIERVDTFAVALIAVGVWALFSKETLARTILSGLLLGASFFAKQPGLLAFGAVFLGLFVAGERKRALTFGISGAAIFVFLFAYLEITTGSWFRYYCLTLPSSHGIRPQLLSTFFLVDMPKCFALSIGSIAIVAATITSIRARVGREAAKTTSWKDTVFGFVVLATMGSAFVQRAHQGGWPNVLILWLPFACAATAIAASRIEEAYAASPEARRVQALLLGGIALQLVAGTFDPTEIAPEASDLDDRARFVGLVRTLEARGPVLVTATGDVTPSIHAGALYDLLRSGARAPRDLRDAIERRSYAALITWSPDEPGCDEAGCAELVALTTRNYFVAGKRHERRHTGRIGFDAWPEWILLPRRHPFPEMTENEVRIRRDVEMGLADIARTKAPLDGEIAPDPAIEDEATRVIAAP